MNSDIALFRQSESDLLGVLEQWNVGVVKFCDDADRIINVILTQEMALYCRLAGVSYVLLDDTDQPNGGLCLTVGRKVCSDHYPLDYGDLPESIVEGQHEDVQPGSSAAKYIKTAGRCAYELSLFLSVVSCHIEGRKLVLQVVPVMGSSIFFMEVEMYGTPELDMILGVEVDVNDYDAVPDPLPELRPYQSRIINEVHRNSLIVLGTGLGKTRIAMELSLKNGGPVLFIVPTAVLGSQMTEEFRKMISLKGLSLNVFHKRRMLGTYGGEDVTIATSGCGLGVELGRYKLIVVDEAHHIIKNSKERQIVHRGRDLGIQIVGLTASPCYNDSELYMTIRRMLDDMGGGDVYALNDEEEQECKDISLLKTAPPVKILSTEKGMVYETFMTSLLEGTACVQAMWLYHKVLLTHRTIGLLSQDMSWMMPDTTDLTTLLDFCLTQLSLRIGTRNAWLVSVTKSHLCREMDPKVDLLYQIVSYINFLSAIRCRGGKMDDCMVHHLTIVFRSELYRDMPDGEVAMTFEDLKDTLDEKGKGHVIVFCATKLLATMAYSIACKRLSGKYDLIECVLRKGKGWNPSVEVTSLVRQLRCSDKTFLLFSTSILDEGIDISTADLVVNMDMIQSMVSYMQKKGRARSADAVHIEMAQREKDFESAERLQPTVIKAIQSGKQSEDMRAVVREVVIDRKLAGLSTDSIVNNLRQRALCNLEPFTWVSTLKTKLWCGKLENLGYSVESTGPSKRAVVSDLHQRWFDALLSD